MIETADYIIVGAGPGGCAVASRLAEARPDQTIAILETGPAQASILSDIPLGIAALVAFRGRHNYGYQTVPQPGLNGRRGFQPRGRGVGGSSLINAMIYIRGQRQDYDSWAETGCTGWSWSDVLPYFKRAEDNARGADALHGAGGPLRVEDLREDNPATQAFVQAAQQCGFAYNPDFNGPVQEGVGEYQVFQKAGRRFSAARAYLEGTRKRSNIVVIADAQCSGLVFEGKRVTGVRYSQGGIERRLSARQEVILAAGAFGTPQLLMASGIGPADHLTRFGIPVVHDLREVGANLQDHLDYTISARSGAKGLFGVSLGVAGQAIGAFGPWKRDGRGMLTTNVAEAGGFVKSDPALARPDLQLHFCLGIVDDHNRKLHLGRGYSLHVCALRPYSRGEVRLASADLRNAPLIDPKFLSDERDLETLVAGAKISQRILSAPPMAAMNARPVYGSKRDDDARLRELIRDHADTIYHPVGTCRMGGDAASVVDPQLRVRGVAGLRVADASIMPSLVSGNTQAPTAMIGEKAADLILGVNARAESERLIA